MKTLLLCLCLLSLPAQGDVKWTHRVTEGEDGGISANYFFFDTFEPDYKDGTLMSVQKVRAVYVSKALDGSTVIDYSIESSGIHVRVSTADKKAVMELIAGKDAALKAVSKFAVKGEAVVGEFYPKAKQALTKRQQEMIYNLVYILAMQRSPIPGKPAGGGPQTARPESK